MPWVRLPSVASRPRHQRHADSDCMWTRFKGYDAKDPTAASRLRLLWSGGCFSSALALACTPVHDLDAYAARGSTASSAAGSAAMAGSGDASDAALPTADEGLPGDGTAPLDTLGDGSAARP